MGEHLSWADFGRAFVEAAVTTDRVAAALREVAGEEIRIGPMPAGPGDVAVVTAVGTLGDVTATRLGEDDGVAFRVEIGFAMALDVALGGQHHRYRSTLTVPLRLAVRPAPPLRLLIEVVPPRSREVVVSVEPKGLQARVIARAGNIEAQIAIQAAAYVREQLADPRSAERMVIDLEGLVEQAWPGG